MDHTLDAPITPDYALYTSRRHEGLGYITRTILMKPSWRLISSWTEPISRSYMLMSGLAALAGRKPHTQLSEQGTEESEEELEEKSFILSFFIKAHVQGIVLHIVQQKWRTHNISGINVGSNKEIKIIICYENS